MQTALRHFYFKHDSGMLEATTGSQMSRLVPADLKVVTLMMSAAATHFP